ncbi:transposase domain-containing protein [Variovorax sp. M-6]|uniref:transposase domain-containing protein n=1 Tax=Variovorax sp. M-6 TaxID=3233041 RepID=UPI003F957F10
MTTSPSWQGIPRARIYLKDVLERLPLHPNHRIDELLPHRWYAPESATTAP